MAKKPSLVSQELLDAAKAPKARKGDRKPTDSVQHHIDATDVLGSLKLHKSKKAYGGAVPDRIPIDKEDPEAYFRRLITWSFAVSPLFNRPHRADGGSVEDIEAAIRAADEVNRNKEESHEKGVSGAVEFAPVGVTEPLTGARLPLGSLPKETARVAEPALQAVSEIAPYFTPAAPIAAARDVAVGLREGDPTNVALSALGLPGKAAKAAAIGASAFMPEEAEAGVIDRALKAIRAYHGSPHEFEKFDPAFIGSGEGAQAYGHGLYFAENPEIAEQYHRELADPQLYLKGKPVEDIKFQSPEYFADMALKNAFKSDFRHRDENPFNFSRHHLDVLKQHGRLPDDDSYEQALNILQNWKGAGAEVKRPGHVYEVGIHADPEHMLDWDKSLSSHHPKIQEALSSHPQSRRLLGNDVVRGQLTAPTGQSILNRLLGSPEEKTEQLSEMGIPGIKYLDQGSRGFGEGTRNYVVFDPNLIDIKNKYAEGGDVEAQPEVARQPSVVDRALNFVSQFNPVGTAEAGPLSSIAKAAKAGVKLPPVPLEQAMERVVSPFSQDPDKVRQAIELARDLRIQQEVSGPKSDYYLVGQSRAPKDVTTKIEPIPNLPLKTANPMTWEDFYNTAKDSTFINLGGDRSNFGRLTHINDQELSWPIDLHAGAKYMLEPSPGAVWANAPGPATGFKKAVSQAAKEGDVYGVFSPMGPTAVDSSHNMFDALMAQIPNQKISKKAAKEFDQAIMSGSHWGSPEEKKKAAELLENWPGISNSKEASEFARQLPGGHRRAIVQYMDTKGWRDKGFPMVGETRVAITDPELRGAPKSMMGHRVVKFNPQNITPETSFEHSTYPVATGGEYVGDVPLALRHYVMPEALEKIVTQPAKDKSIIHPFSVDPRGRSSARKFFEEQKLLQGINQRFLDSVMQEQERRIKYGLKKGGSVISDALDVVSSLPK